MTGPWGDEPSAVTLTGVRITPEQLNALAVDVNRSVSGALVLAVVAEPTVWSI
jgi:hypothetical protein